MQIFVAVLSGSALAALINQIGALLLERERNTGAVQDGMRILLLDRIQYVGQAYIKAGAVDFDDRRRLTMMHEAYHKLGGNGDLNCLMDEVNRLPLKQ